MLITGYTLRHGSSPCFLWGKNLQCSQKKEPSDAHCPRHESTILEIYILRIGHEGFLYNLYEIPKGNMHGYASNQSKCKKKMLLNLLRDFQTWLAFAKFHGVWFVCLPFPQRITKVVFCPQNMQNLPHIALGDKEDLNTDRNILEDSI